MYVGRATFKRKHKAQNRDVSLKLCSYIAYLYFICSSNLPSIHNASYQTARSVSPTSSSARPSYPPPNSESEFPLLRQLATIPNPQHERLVRSLNLGREQDRFRSFTATWSRDLLPPPNLMARAGWFYLGNLDRTQCFSCGQVLRNWRREDDPAEEHRRHFPQCRMAQGNEPRNVPDRTQVSHVFLKQYFVGFSFRTQR